MLDSLDLFVEVDILQEPVWLLVCWKLCRQL